MLVRKNNEQQEDSMVKREQFAVSLRQKKKHVILEQKRRKLYEQIMVRSTLDLLKNSKHLKLDSEAGVRGLLTSFDFARSSPNTTAQTCYEVSSAILQLS